MFYQKTFKIVEKNPAQSKKVFRNTYTKSTIKMHNKITMRYHYSPTRISWLKFYKTVNIVVEDTELLEPYILLL
jgi:hypothetical protein